MSYMFCYFFGNIQVFRIPLCERDSKIPKGQRDIVKSESRQYHGKKMKRKTTPYAGAAVTLVNKNGKFTIGKSKTSLLS